MLQAALLKRIPACMLPVRAGCISSDREIFIRGTDVLPAPLEDRRPMRLRAFYRSRNRDGKERADRTQQLIPRRRLLLHAKFDNVKGWWRI